MESSLWIRIIVFIIHIVVILYDITTFIPYYIVQMPWKRRYLSKRIKAKPIASDRTQITYRSVESFCEMRMELDREIIDTLDKMLSYAATQHTVKSCLGTRQIFREENDVLPNGQTIKQYKVGNYKWRNFMNVNNSAINFGRGLHKLGIEPRQRAVFYAETEAEWMIAAHGCFKANITVVTIYTTLSNQCVINAINETEATLVITSYNLFPKLKQMQSEISNVRVIVYLKDQVNRTDTSGFKDDIRILSHLDVNRMGSYSKMAFSSPTADDIALIMYTSGSTGTPKGVHISHQNCMSTIKGFCDIIEICPTDIMLGTLPLDDTFEFAFENFCLLSGVPIGYSTLETMTDSGNQIQLNTKGDITMLRPTFVPLIPLQLNRIRKEIQSKIIRSSLFAKEMYELAYAYKKIWIRNGFQTPILDLLIFRRFANILGGRIRLIFTGNAMLSPETQELIEIFLCTKICAVYGITETGFGGTATDPYDLTIGCVGAPLNLFEFRLYNWYNCGYRVTNKPNPQGEICIGGRALSYGYYKLDEKTREACFIENGRRWFKTGDIGEFHKNGVLKIIDRKSNLIKLHGGECISLGKIETELSTCLVVDFICAYADSTGKNCMALIVPNRTYLAHLATVHGVSNMEFEDICKLPSINQEVLKLITKHGQRCNLQKIEIPSVITLCTEMWTPESGLLTAKMNINHAVIYEYYAEDINRMRSIE